MFLLVSGRHVGAHLGGHQYGVSIQISINLGKTFVRISSIRKIAVTWILAGVFAYLPSFYFQILDLIYSTVLIFLFSSILNGVSLKISNLKTPAFRFRVDGKRFENGAFKVIPQSCWFWFKIDQHKKSKPFNRLSPESGNRKRVDIQRPSPRFRSREFFLWKICGETFSPNL